VAGTFGQPSRLDGKRRCARLSKARSSMIEKGGYQLKYWSSRVLRCGMIYCFTVIDSILQDELLVEAGVRNERLLQHPALFERLLPFDPAEPGLTGPPRSPAVCPALVWSLKRADRPKGAYILPDWGWQKSRPFGPVEANEQNTRQIISILRAVAGTEHCTAKRIRTCLMSTPLPGSIWKAGNGSFLTPLE
jgi:hypothetical protein